MGNKSPSAVLIDCAVVGDMNGCVNALKDGAATTLIGVAQQPMHVAAANGHVGIMRLLIQHNANPHVEDATGRSPLHWAVFRGQLPAVKALIMECHANIDQVDSNGDSARDWAEKDNKRVHRQGDKIAAFLADPPAPITCFWAVAEVLQRANLEKFRDNFLPEEIIYSDLKLITEPDLERMDIPIGPRRRLLEIFANLPEDVDEKWYWSRDTEERLSKHIDSEPPLADRVPDSRGCLFSN